eukprot:1139018-Pelagomonas_calceolata.AAC.5
MQEMTDGPQGMQQRMVSCANKTGQSMDQESWSATGIPLQISSNKLSTSVAVETRLNYVCVLQSARMCMLCFMLHENRAPPHTWRSSEQNER